MKEVYIVSATRTPIGSFGGSLATLSATQIGALVIKSAIEKAGLQPADVQEIYMGNVLSANLGQAPATQAAVFAGLPYLPATTVNKVCASGMKAVMLAAQSIACGDNDVVLAGGMESMSNVPYYLDKARNGYRLGNGQIIDGLVKDGLWDVYNDYHMGSAAELCAVDCNVTREEQDAFAITSYKRAQAAQTAGKFNAEITPVELKDKKGEVTLFTDDEEPNTVKFDKIPTLKPVFKKDGTVTAANASTLNDGAAALVLMSKEKADAMGIKPLAKIVSFADAQQAPEYFTTAPAKAIPLALHKAGLTAEQIDFFEINEAFSVVAVANNKILQLDPAKVNVNGGAVAIGHPLGASGARIIVTLIHVLQQNGGKLGAAGICNGGGGASALVIENLS
ncbi:acetyl-CoA C-acyltransferase [Mucilaginibacter phyllosphaerae]|uniref:Acetyl-CoA C-acetyltransferase n=1 Tax=Mucilaginibacter phyllosphaerae TaxID=1812349 RepID=A0A4Y8ABL3_9SPHI|nr:acetyl-CoA C-acyltransferase [Mucilaginibacter phyllosphaerae]MBB3969238.1 acetyl-CoA C-acetyltransferase [Mucilaginibacter phyllosphaerae]TEW65961.1 acetyl-CoA C-acyltransferase [Mucilaginibacter phyllosphaerae]GGH07170.1 acetyl-CoA acetyltransferase [Mucilaginibacter phyllosphaerae]